MNDELTATKHKRSGYSAARTVSRAALKRPVRQTDIAANAVQVNRLRRRLASTVDLLDTLSAEQLRMALNYEGSVTSGGNVDKIPR